MNTPYGLTLRRDITLWSDNTAFIYGRSGFCYRAESAISKSSRERINHLSRCGEYQSGFILGEHDILAVYVRAV